MLSKFRLIVWRLVWLNGVQRADSISPIEMQCWQCSVKWYTFGVHGRLCKLVYSWTGKSFSWFVWVHTHILIDSKIFNVNLIELMSVYTSCRAFPSIHQIADQTGRGTSRHHSSLQSCWQTSSSSKSINTTTCRSLSALFTSQMFQTRLTVPEYRDKSHWWWLIWREILSTLLLLWWYDLCGFEELGESFVLSRDCLNHSQYGNQYDNGRSLQKVCVNLPNR